MPAWFHEGQRLAWESDSQEIVVCSGTQGGKTALNAPWLLRLIQRTTLDLLRRQAIPYFHTLFVERHQLGTLIGADTGRPKFRFSAEGAVRLCGTQVPIVVHFLNMADPESNESFTALGGVWDEAGQATNKELSFEANNRRLGAARSLASRANIPYLGSRLWTTTPYDHTWFKRRIVDPAIRGDRGCSWHNWPSWANPGGISEEQARKELEGGMPLWRWQMMYEGEFTRPAGAVYDCFTSANIVRPFPIPSSWPLVVGMDFGSANLAGVFGAIDPSDDSIVIFSSYWAGSDTLQKHVDVMKTKAGKKPSLVVGGAQSESNWRRDFTALDWPVRAPSLQGPDSVEAGISRVYGQFATKKLKIFSDLTALIDEIQGYTRVVDGEGRVTSVIQDKSSYHRLDALRYLVGTLRPGSGATQTRRTSRILEDEEPNAIGGLV
ncbi:MAG: hypothetical protein MUC92_04620 [Fimbriimonadaceae bacterium]|nr:hypothetical protein [Fimbriimonadaceae bacterium]